MFVFIPALKKKKEEKKTRKMWYLYSRLPHTIDNRKFSALRETIADLVAVVCYVVGVFFSSLLRRGVKKSSKFAIIRSYLYGKFTA